MGLCRRLGPRFYAHFFAVWVLLVHAGALIAAKGRKAASRSWVECYAAIGALAAPMAYWALTLDHDPIEWLAAPGWGAIPATLAQLAGDSFLQLGAVLAACLLALPRAVRSRRLAFASPSPPLGQHCRSSRRSRSPR